MPVQWLETWISGNPRSGAVLVLVLGVLALVGASSLILMSVKRARAGAKDLRTRGGKLWRRLERAWETGRKDWRDSREKPDGTPRPSRRGNLGAVLRKPIRWLSDHLIQVFAWSLAWTLAVLLTWRVFKQVKGGSFDPSQVELVLLGLVAGFIVLARSGRDLLLRLKKVGPVEFIEKRFDRIVPELREIGTSVHLDGPSPPLSEGLLWEYEKAESYVTHLEWSGLEASGLLLNAKLHDLLFKMSAIALLQKKWARAADRLELLLKISEGRFKAADAHYRCGVAYTELAIRSQAKAREKAELAQKAQEHLRKAVDANPQDRLAYFHLAYVQQMCLEDYELALKNNERAIALFKGFTRAKFNLAICFVKLGKREEAAKAIESIDPNDEDAQSIQRAAQRDEKLATFLHDPDLGGRVQRHLRKLSP